MPISPQKHQAYLNDKLRLHFPPIGRAGKQREPMGGLMKMLSVHNISKHVFVMYVIRYFIFERLQALASAHFPTLLVLRSIPVPFSHSIMIYSLFHPLMVSWSCHDTNVPLQKITLFILFECKKHPLHSQPCPGKGGPSPPKPQKKLT